MLTTTQVGIIQIEIGIAIGIEEIWPDELDRMAAMLSRFCGRGDQVRDDQAAYSVDFDPDSDFEPEERKSQQTDALDAYRDLTPCTCYPSMDTTP